MRRQHVANTYGQIFLQSGTNTQPIALRIRRGQEPERATTEWVTLDPLDTVSDVLTTTITNHTA
ncbi:hypothetical protein EV643_12525 [Kribbella sp. VKM Ac-2527]|uniref:Uncharacterized protein n=1 Tax=Kribbella caucasensis TaxID=2512215 RepID=A0A4V3C6V2_9ACTN|nr:hypothetical protein [Kribbella sp. VKM Ac-2527]TDO34768.1 hypothetical protein EV643_12525 [Kribbella sp. VKM Ac-2527]